MYLVKIITAILLLFGVAACCRTQVDSVYVKKSVEIPIISNIPAITLAEARRIDPLVKHKIELIETILTQHIGQLEHNIRMHNSEEGEKPKPDD